MDSNGNPQQVLTAGRVVKLLSSAARIRQVAVKPMPGEIPRPAYPHWGRFARVPPAFESLFFRYSGKVCFRACDYPLTYARMEYLAC